MNVILLDDLEGVGARGAMVSVKPGYARNFLLPRKLAILADGKAQQVYSELLRQRETKAHRELEAARGEAAKLNGVEINISAQANEEDHLFGSVTNADVAEALAKAGQVVDKRKIQLEEPIKQLGKYDVIVALHHGVTATVKVWVVRP